jgi:hypothetical protein
MTFDDEVNCMFCNSGLRYIPYVLRERIKKILFGNGCPSYLYDEYDSILKGHLLRTSLFLDLLKIDPQIPKDIYKRIKKEITDFKWGFQLVKNDEQAFIEEVRKVVERKKRDKWLKYQ